MRIRPAIALLAGAALVLPATAAAQPPVNDARDQAAALPLRGAVSGSLAEATLETGVSDQPGGAPTNLVASQQVVGDLWYTIDAPAKSSPFVVRLSGKDLDAVIAVSRVTRTGTVFVAADPTDRDSRAGVRVGVPKGGATFVVRVAQVEGSTGSPDFTLSSAPAAPDTTYPGVPLPRGGGRGVVDRLSNLDDAWSSVLRAGTTYRVNLSHSPTRTSRLRIYSPLASWSLDPTYSRRSGGYVLLTPGPGFGGRWTFVVETSDQRRDQPYRLSIGPARADDMAPGLALRDRHRVRGRLEGGRLDAVDLYRIDVPARSHVVLRLRTAKHNGFSLRLLSTRGRTVGSVTHGTGNIQVRKGLHRGRYYVAVRARYRAHGTYSLLRVDRALTGTSLRVDGARRARITPGATARLTLDVHPAGVDGPTDVRIERFDPLSGWHFFAMHRVHVRGGHATYAFRPPAEGTWRADAHFRGTGKASPSDSRWVRIVVQAPLRDSR